MQLNHLNLSVSDVASTTAFFEKHFDFTCVDRKGENMLSVLYGKDGFILTLMSDAFNKEGNKIYPNAFHCGFILPTAAEVTNLYNQLKEEGVVLDREPANIRNSFGFYFHFDRLLIEVGHYFK